MTKIGGKRNHMYFNTFNSLNTNKIQDIAVILLLNLTFSLYKMIQHNFLKREMSIFIIKLTKIISVFFLQHLLL